MPRRIASIVVTLSALAAGCSRGPESGVAVSGRVSYKGRPVKAAVISFLPDLNKPGRGASGDVADGRYSIPAEAGPLPGEFNVMFFDPRRVAPQAQPDPAEPTVPERYQEMNELRVVVPARKSASYDFELRDERDEPVRPLKPPKAVE